MDHGPVFVDYGAAMHDSAVPGLNYHFDFESDHGGGTIVVDPSLTLSPYTASSAESQFLTPSSASILSPGSSVEYFGDHKGSFGGSDTVAPHDTVHTSPTTAAKDNMKNMFSSSAAAAATTTTTTTTTASTSRRRKSASQSTESAAAPRTKKQKTTQAALKQESSPIQDAPKRRPARRNTSHTTASVSSASSSSSSSSSGNKKEDTAQRSKNLERNRIAASKCRQKKKEWVHELEETKSGMELRHSCLRMEYFQLLDEVTRIKNHLMAHATCNDPNINFWIEKEALRFVERCMDPSHEKRPSLTSNGSGSFTLSSPADSHQSATHLTSPIDKSNGINLDYMPDELLAGESL